MQLRGRDLTKVRAFFSSCDTNCREAAAQGLSSRWRGTIGTRDPASILLVTEWPPLAPEQRLCPTQGDGRAGRERHVPAESVPIYEESSISPGRHPAVCRSHLIGGNGPCDHPWVQGNLGRRHLIWDIVASNGPGSIGKNEGGIGVEEKRACLGAIISVFPMS